MISRNACTCSGRTRCAACSDWEKTRPPARPPARPPLARTRLNRTVVAVVLRRFRHARGLSQQQAARALGIGRSTLSLLERRMLGSINTMTAQRLLAGLDLPVKHLWQ